VAKQLSQDIIDKLKKRTGKVDKTIRKEISLTKRDYPQCTSNAAAQIFALKHGTSVLQKLDIEDRATLPERPSQIIIRSQARVKKKSNGSKKAHITPLFQYDTSNFFKKTHIEELFKAHSAGCFTSVYILFRKILENLLIDILRAKYPEKRKEFKELYYDISQNRFRDFSKILENIKSKRSDFGIDGKKIIDRLIQLVKPFKKDANDKAHSWYHIVRSKSEVDSVDFVAIIELIKRLEQLVGLR